MHRVQSLGRLGSFLVLASLQPLALAACGESHREPTREWTPDDHQPPPSSGATPGRSAPPEEAASREEVEARMAASLYRTNCATCHGPAGRGDGPGRPPGASVPDLTSEELQASRTHQDLARVIAQGRGLMPGFADRISPEGMALLVMYVRGLAAVPAGEGAAAPGPAAPAPEPGSDEASGGTDAPSDVPEATDARAGGGTDEPSE